MEDRSEPLGGVFTEMPFGTRGRIFRSCMPASRRYDKHDRVLGAATAAGVSVVVSLVGDAECALESARPSLRRDYARLGWEIISVPVDDFQTPAGAQREAFERAVRAVCEHARAGRNILVHCHAGIGRTGTFLGCVARMLDTTLTGDEAIRKVRRAIPRAIETIAQEDLVRAFSPETSARGDER